VVNTAIALDEQDDVTAVAAELLAQYGTTPNSPDANSQRSSASTTRCLALTKQADDTPPPPSVST